METGAEWSLEAVQALRTMAQEGLPPSTMSMRLRRPVEAVRAKLDELGITPAVET